jgi:hypothetical protein
MDLGEKTKIFSHEKKKSGFLYTDTLIMANTKQTLFTFTGLSGQGFRYNPVEL